MRSIAVGAFAFAIASSCLIDRRTSDFACDDNTDCELGRVCTDGFCAVDDSFRCDDTVMSCNIECNTPGQCSNVVCPPGFECNIDCTATNACGAIDCSAAAACDIECNSTTACGGIDCGTGDCKVSCSGTNACGAVDCANACECDVDCNRGDCASFACPTTGADCTDGNADGCDHTQAGCSTCP